MLKVQLFGSGQAQHYNRMIPGFPQQRACLLFSYLLLNKNHPHHRERLAALFWGDYSTEKARKYLRNALWRLRQTLQSVGIPNNEYLMISDDSVSFINSSPYWIDVEVFEETIIKNQETSIDQMTADHATHLESAVDLYIGDLLETVYEDWCLYDRERLRMLYLSTLNKLMVFHGNHGAYEKGLSYGEKILILDNTREKVHRQMMWLHWMAGDRNAAIAQFQRCRQILREELGIRPLNETRQVYDDILHNQNKPTSLASLKAELSNMDSSASDSAQSLTESALHKISRLQIRLEETRSELRQIEKLISQALVNSRHG
jgi:DNA-binding SARP family transcriptional activator